MEEAMPDVALRTVVDTAKYLSLSRAKVYLLCDSGDLEGVKLGKSMRITQESIDRYIKNAKRKPRKDDE
jgi:excisionase family DNA binding protein